MKLAEARRVIASYLAGGEVPAAQLEEARRAASEDREYLAALRAELGVSPAEIGDCAIFMANVAEFCEMSDTQRRLEAPELLAHVRSCPSCRHVYRQVHPPLTSVWVAAATKAGASLVKTLVEPIALALDSAGQLLEEGLGPPALALRRVAVTAHAPQPGGTNYKEWLLADQEAGCAIRLLVETLPSGEVQLKVLLEGAGAECRLEVRGAGGSLALGGPLLDIQADPLKLKPGEWTLRLVVSRPVSRTWEIPLQLVSDSQAPGGLDG